MGCLHENIGNYLIQSVRYTIGSGWEQPQNVAFSEPVFDLKVALDENSNALIIWEGENSQSFLRNLFAAQSNPGSEWNIPQIIGIDSGQSFYPSVAIDKNGNAFILWASGEFSPNNIYITPYSSITGWGTPQLIATNTGAAAWTNIQFDNIGNAVALWGQGDNSSQYHTYASYYSAVGGWMTAVQIDSNNNLSSIDQYLSVDQAGIFNAVWTQQTQTGIDIYNSRYNNGWTAPQLVGSGGNARYPRAASDGRGNTFVTWQQYDPTDLYPGDANVYVNQYEENSGWAVQRQVKNHLGGADAPEIAVDSRGYATVIWSQQVDAVNYSIFTGRFQ